MKLPRHRLLALSILSVAPAAAASLPSATCLQIDTASAVDPLAVPKELQADDWASIRAAYEAGRHAFFAIDQGHQARSHGNGWQARFDGQGVILDPDAGGWSCGFALERYGFEGALVAANQAEDVRAVGQHLTYDWDAGLSEWWTNDTRGLEHGFTVHKRPHRMDEDGGGPLIFDMKLRGNLRPILMASGRGLRLVGAQGEVVLTYDGLVAFDADGASLETWLEVTDLGLRIAVLEDGARYPLTVDPIMQTAYLKASNTNAGDRFGAAVAVSGNTVVVGANTEDSNATGVDGDQSDNSAINSGAAYVFVRTGSTWSQQAYLKASNTEAADQFGFSVAVSGDIVVVGARVEGSSATGVNGDQSDNSAVNSGAAYVFVRTGSTWIQQAYLKASNTDANDNFGEPVVVSGDTVVVGADGEDSSATGIDGDQSNNNAINSGAAYVFVRAGSTWIQQAYLKASNASISDTFAESVAVSGDTVIVGATAEDSNATGVDGDQSDNSAINSGAAYVFVRTGSTWSQQAYLKASNTEGGDFFGESVAVSGDTAVVGAIREDSEAAGVNGNQANNGTSSSGAAYAFVRTGSTWSQQAYLKASNPGAEDLFGFTVAVSGDAVVVGSPLEDSSATGINGNQFNNSEVGSGAAYLFARMGNTWSQQAYLKASNTDNIDSFGARIALSGGTLIIGASGEDSDATGVNGNQSNNNANSAGAAYIFDLSDLSTIGSGICQPAMPNSTGLPSTLTAEGSDIAADNSLTLIATDLPLNQFGFLINAMNTQMVSISDGILCIGPDVGRHNSQAGSSGMTGTISTTVDLSNLPRPSGGPQPALAGQTWYFQVWHRDGPGISNFTNGIEILFQ